MATWRRWFGDQGEKAAAQYLQSQGLKILDRQYGVRGGEIDLVAQDGEEIVFVEVKSRRDESFGFPEEAVTPAKIRKIRRAIQYYLQAKKQEDRPWRIDVVAIQFANGQEPKVHHVKAVDMPEGLW
ncbi:YraN family protein [Patescibacteria group bacterium]|nr:YraN family protein [Patescibacteria group bacterium]MBU1705253.1 YraN family protein [Patescibacteria group bacterium]